MLMARDFARRRRAASSLPELAAMGGYDHEAQRRWIGDEASLVVWLMKSDTTFDGESRDKKDPNETDAEGF